MIKKINLSSLLGFKIGLPMPKIGLKGHGGWEGPDLPERELPDLDIDLPN